jgi:hypothetical protein
MREQRGRPKKTFQKFQTPAKKENSNSIKSNLLPQRCGSSIGLGATMRERYSPQKISHHAVVPPGVVMFVYTMLSLLSSHHVRRRGPYLSSTTASPSIPIVSTAILRRRLSAPL